MGASWQAVQGHRFLQEGSRHRPASPGKLVQAPDAPDGRGQHLCEVSRLGSGRLPSKGDAGLICEYSPRSGSPGSVRVRRSRTAAAASLSGHQGPTLPGNLKPALRPGRTGLDLVSHVHNSGRLGIGKRGDDSLGTLLKFPKGSRRPNRESGEWEIRISGSGRTVSLRDSLHGPASLLADS